MIFVPHPHNLHFSLSPLSVYLLSHNCIFYPCLSVFLPISISQQDPPCPHSQTSSSGFSLSLRRSPTGPPSRQSPSRLISSNWISSSIQGGEREKVVPSPPLPWPLLSSPFLPSPFFFSFGLCRLKYFRDIEFPSEVDKFTYPAVTEKLFFFRKLSSCVWMLSRLIIPRTVISIFVGWIFTNKVMGGVARVRYVWKKTSGLSRILMMWRRSLKIRDERAGVRRWFNRATGRETSKISAHYEE